MRNAPRRSYRWLHDLLDVLYSDVDVETAVRLLREPDERQHLPSRVPGVADLLLALTDLEPREFDNLLVALLSLRVKFPQDEARSKVEVNIAMRERRR